MGYQALLFCPDERTARTVTQVLAELEFAVTPCTEPFAAVKKLMGEHFDAVVVDCDNEQNATLLFKSARNAPNNQSALAVAVVEGQAGVAKAFRIGANLVLTKPINVDQAKGTLRVARGLLRKGEGTKPATPTATAAAQPSAPVLSPPKPAPQATIQAVSKRPTPIAPLATAAAASITIRKPAPQPTVVASAPTEIPEVGSKPIAIASEETASVAKPETHASAPEIDSIVSTPAKVESKIKIETAASQSMSSVRLGAGAASAPAPAREAKPNVTIEDKPSAIISEPETASEKVTASASSASGEEVAAPSSFTFGGNVSKPSGGSKKALLAVVAVVLVAVGGYEAWLQWNTSGGYATTPVRAVTQRASTPSAIPQTAPSAPSSNASSAMSAVPSSTMPTQPSGSATSTSDVEASDVPENLQPHASKGSSGADSAKPAVSVAAANKAPATSEAEQPILIKNGHSRPVAKTTASMDEPVPSITGIAAAGNGGTLPNLIGGESKAPTPVLQTMNVSQGVSRGLLVKTVQPAYPSIALRMRTEGPVELMATITKSGDISAVKILSGDAGLAHAAAEAVKQWKYKPYLLNGEPVEIQTQVTVIFKLPN
ncbi:MAG: TonB family protein [Candidatus Sulfotelmatobacter sp.]